MLYNETPSLPLKSAPSHEYVDPMIPSNTPFLGSTRVLNPHGISIGSTVFAGLTSVTDRPTGDRRHSVGRSGTK